MSTQKASVLVACVITIGIACIAISSAMPLWGLILVAFLAGEME